MAILKGADAASFVRRPAPETICALIYGSDGGAIRETTQAIVRAVAGTLDDPFAVARLDERLLAQDPGRLADEVRALPLLGGKRVVWVNEPGAQFAEALAPLLEAGQDGNLIVAEAGELLAKARLRLLCEASPRAVVLPIYDESERDILGLVGQELQAAHLQIGEEARARLLSFLGGGRSDSRQQLAKLIAYCLGEREVTLAAVEACCGDASELDPEGLVDAALDGDLEETDRQFARLVESGMAGSRLLSAAAFQIGRLQRLRLEVDRRKPVQQVVKFARPPIFYQRQATVTRQLHAFDSEDLAAMLSALGAATRQTREWGMLEDSIAARAVLSLARSARIKHSGRG